MGVRAHKKKVLARTHTMYMAVIIKRNLNVYHFWFFNFFSRLFFLYPVNLFPVEIWYSAKIRYLCVCCCCCSSREMEKKNEEKRWKWEKEMHLKLKNFVLIVFLIRSLSLRSHFVVVLSKIFNRINWCVWRRCWWWWRWWFSHGFHFLLLRSICK